MKKNIHVLITGVLAIGFIVLLFFTFKKDQQIVYVDTFKLLNEYKGMKEAQAQFEVKSKTWQANVDTLAFELEQSIKKFESERPKLSKKEIELSEELLRTKQNQYLQYKQAIQQKATEEERKLQDQVLATVNGYIKEYGKDKSYTMIMGATTMGNIVYADKVTDITEEVLIGLNSTYSQPLAANSKK